MSDEEMEIQSIILGDQDNLVIKFAKFVYEWAILIGGVILLLYVMIKV